MCRKKRRVEERISILVPFSSKVPGRLRVWHWLRRHWAFEMPHAELIIGRDRASEKHWYRKHPPTFSKTAAVNDAFRRSHGDIIVILDADAYVQGEVIQHCADRIRAARKVGVPLWFIPYTRLYRLSEEITNDILESEPDHPLVVPDPPPAKDVDGIDGSGWGHYFGARSIQIMLPVRPSMTVGWHGRRDSEVGVARTWHSLSL